MPAKVLVRLEISSCNVIHRFSRPHRRLSCKFELNWSITAKLRSLYPVFCRNTPKNPFFRSFLAQNVFLFCSDLRFLLLAHLLQPNGQLSSKFQHNGINTEKLRSVFLEFSLKTPKKPFFRHFLAQNVIFFCSDLHFLLLAHLLQSNGQLSFKFGHNPINTEKVRSVFLEFSLKTPKKPFFRRFLAQNVIFFCSNWRFLLLAHLLQPNRQLSSEFEHNRVNTEKFRSVLLEFPLQTPKKPFFRRFLAQNVNFFCSNLRFLLLAHLLQPNGQLPSKFEHNRINTEKMRSVFLEFYQKTPKKPFFRRFLAQNVNLFCSDLRFLLLAHLLQPNGQLSSEFEHNRINTKKLQSVFLEFSLKTPKMPFFRRFWHKT